MFTGDRSGDFLFAALARTGMANQATSRTRGDGLALRDVWVAAAVRCAPPGNRPLPVERDACLPWSVREIGLLSELRVIVCLGAFAWTAGLRLTEALGAWTRGRGAAPRFGHGAELAGERYVLIGCYHPSQQNTFTAGSRRRCSMPSSSAPGRWPPSRPGEWAIGPDALPAGSEER